jgi:hypothetical protein
MFGLEPFSSCSHYEFYFTNEKFNVLPTLLFCWKVGLISSAFSLFAVVPLWFTSWLVAEKYVFGPPLIIGETRTRSSWQ